MTTDEWVTAALTDDAMVVELLFRLKQSLDWFAPRPVQLLGWGYRKPRSKPATNSKKERESTRYSPTTPLSWSGGTSTSDGCDDSSRPSDRSSSGRSKTWHQLTNYKGTFTNDTTATASKRLKRKKTYAELKEEESLLLKERIHLKKEITTLRESLKEQKAKSQNLKRVKLDLHLQSTNKMVIASDVLPAVDAYVPNLVDASTPDQVQVFPPITEHDDLSLPGSCKLENEVETSQRCFVLPDLNMIPSEEDTGCDALYGLS